MENRNKFLSRYSGVALFFSAYLGIYSKCLLTRLNVYAIMMPWRWWLKRYFGRGVDMTLTDTLQVGSVFRIGTNIYMVRTYTVIRNDLTKENEVRINVLNLNTQKWEQVPLGIECESLTTVYEMWNKLSNKF